MASNDHCTHTALYPLPTPTQHPLSSVYPLGTPMHHPFTAPKPEQLNQLNEAPETVLANAYDLVLNGNEIGGGSIRIHDRATQEKMFSLLGFSPESAEAQFGFLMNAFRYGAPPHGGIALGFDRLVALLDGNETIRDYIAFPKNNTKSFEVVNVVVKWFSNKGSVLLSTLY